MKFMDNNFKLVNMPIKEFYISESGNQNDIEKLKNDLVCKTERVGDELKFFDFKNSITFLDIMMLKTKYRTIEITKVFDINNVEIPIVKIHKDFKK